MPKIEEYYCFRCDLFIEIFRREQLVECPQCGQGIKKLFSAFGIGGCKSEHKRRDRRENREAAEYEKEVAEYQAEKTELKKADERWHSEFAHVKNVRTPARAKYLESQERVRQMKEYSNGGI